MTISLRRLLAVVRDEFRHITRDVRILFLVTVAPSFLLVTLSYVFSLDVGRIDIAVRDMDRTPLSRALLADLAADGDILIVADFQREGEIEPLFASDIADLALFIPHGFADAVLAARKAFLIGSLPPLDNFYLSAVLRGLIPAGLRMEHLVYQHPSFEPRDVLRYHQALLDAIETGELSRVEELIIRIPKRPPIGE